jgi:hypothetical protein
VTSPAGPDGVGDIYGKLVATLEAERARVAGEVARLQTQMSALEIALGALSGDGNGVSKPRATTINRQSRPTRGRAKRGTVIVSILKALADKGPAKPALIAAAARAKPTSVSVALAGLQNKKLAARSAAGWTLTAAGRVDLERRAKAGL